MFSGRRINYKSLDVRIEEKREEMIEIGLELGFTHTHTVHLSQELDMLLNKLTRRKFFFNRVKTAQIAIQRRLEFCSFSRATISITQLLLAAELSLLIGK